MKLKYFKRSDRTTSDREVSPQRLVNYRNTWYLDAWCHASEGLRRFALDAVQEARALDTKARHVAVKDLEAELEADVLVGGQRGGGEEFGGHGGLRVVEWSQCGERVAHHVSHPTPCMLSPTGSSGEPPGR